MPSLSRLLLSTVRIGALLALIAAGACLASLHWLWRHQESFIFPGAFSSLPDATEASPWRHDFLSFDGTRIQSWRMPPPQLGAPIVLFLPGNFEQASWFSKDAFPLLSKYGLGGVALNYRGFGLSEGVPSQESLTADSAILIESIKRSYPNSPIVLLGRSLGTAIAAQAYARHPKDIACIALVTPFAGFIDPTSDRLPLIPKSVLASMLRHPFDSRQAFASAPTRPTTVFFSGDDELITPTNTMKLMEVLDSKTQIHIMPNTSHSASMVSTGFWGPMINFATRCSLADSSATAPPPAQSMGQPKRASGQTLEQIPAQIQLRPSDTTLIDQHMQSHIIAIFSKPSVEHSVSALIAAMRH